eukprot:2695377-Pleurochrysis_carterae.AAC.3
MDERSSWQIKQRAQEGRRFVADIAFLHQAHDLTGSQLSSLSLNFHNLLADMRRRPRSSWPNRESVAGARHRLLTSAARLATVQVQREASLGATVPAPRFYNSAVSYAGGALDKR